MNFLFFNKLNLIFPIKLFNNGHFFLKNRYIIIKKYSSFNTSFIKSIKYINNTYYTIIRLFCRIRKNTILTKSRLSSSTNKIYPQKGLGRARAGSKKSPLRRGGAIIFGPVARTLTIMLHTKRRRISFFYLLLNKRTSISFVIMLPILHNFNDINEYLEQQARLNGLFSIKSVYIFFFKIKYILQQGKYPLTFINLLNLNHFLEYDYIIFLI